MIKAIYPKPKFYLNPAICEKLFNLLSEEVFRGYTDSFPPFYTRFPGRLESILNSVELKSELLQQDIFDVAANYFVSINRGHPFQNGNKRLSIFFSDVFLRVHEFSPIIPIDLFLEVSILVNVSKMSDEEIKHEMSQLFKRKYQNV